MKQVPVVRLLLKERAQLSKTTINSQMRRSTELNTAVVKKTDNIEEERRLFYVALTRARGKLFITSNRALEQFDPPVKRGSEL